MRRRGGRERTETGRIFGLNLLVNGLSGEIPPQYPGRPCQQYTYFTPKSVLMARITDPRSLTMSYKPRGCAQQGSGLLSGFDSNPSLISQQRKGGDLRHGAGVGACKLAVGSDVDQSLAEVAGGAEELQHRWPAGWGATKQIGGAAMEMGESVIFLPCLPNFGVGDAGMGEPHLRGPFASQVKSLAGRDPGGAGSMTRW